MSRILLVLGFKSQAPCMMIPPSLPRNNPKAGPSSRATSSVLNPSPRFSEKNALTFRALPFLSPEKEIIEARRGQQTVNAFGFHFDRMRFHGVLVACISDQRNEPRSTWRVGSWEYEIDHGPCVAPICMLKRAAYRGTHTYAKVEFQGTRADSSSTVSGLYFDLLRSTMDG